ncbi:MAG: outer membrane beta-barrel protein [Bacteroidia bacterium]
MKRIVLFFLLVSGFVLAFSQGFNAELLLGANFSQVDGDQLGGYNKLGLNTGIQINRKISDDWEGAFELRYSMKGAKKVIDPEAPPTFTLKLNYQYVEVPLLAKFTRFDPLTLYAGPSIGVNVQNEREENGIKTSETELNKTEIGFHLGGTYYLNQNIGLDLRHSYSLFSVTEKNARSIGPSWFNRTGWYNRLFTIGVVYVP